MYNLYLMYTSNISHKKYELYLFSHDTTSKDFLFPLTILIRFRTRAIYIHNVLSGSIEKLRGHVVNDKRNIFSISRTGMQEMPVHISALIQQQTPRLHKATAANSIGYNVTPLLPQFLICLLLVILNLI